MDVKITIYFAGPLFTQAERIWNANLARRLSAAIPNAQIILPQVEARRYLSNEGVDFLGVVNECIRGIERSDVVVSILDGSDADSGTTWECGYAFAKGKRIIGVRTDLRGSEDDGLNAMLRRTCHAVIYCPATNEDIQSLAKKIADAIL